MRRNLLLQECATSGRIKRKTQGLQRYLCSMPFVSGRHTLLDRGVALHTAPLAHLPAEVQEAGEVYTGASGPAVRADDGGHKFLRRLSTGALLDPQLTHQRCHLLQADAAVAIQVQVSEGGGKEINRVVVRSSALRTILNQPPNKTQILILHLHVLHMLWRPGGAWVVEITMDWPREHAHLH